MTEIEETTATTRDPREHVLTAVRKGHSVTLDAFKAVVDRAAPVTSKLPVVNVTLPQKLPLPEKLPFAEKLPYGEKIPTTEDIKGYAGKIPSRESVVSGVKEFASQLLEEQRKFNGEFKKTAAALRPAPEEPTEEVAGVHVES